MKLPYFLSVLTLYALNYFWEIIDIFFAFVSFATQRKSILTEDNDHLILHNH